MATPRHIVVVLTWGITMGCFMACNGSARVPEKKDVLRENSAALCSDFEDNDGDDLVNCDDPDCAPFCAGPETLCADTEDNDGDGRVDCDDGDCRNAASCGGAREDCIDSIDNDGDRLIDCQDPDCSDLPVCSTNEDTTGECSDAQDNDGDKLIDCADPDCEKVGFCGAEASASRCQDKIDNDADSLTDCADSGCAQLEVCTVGVRENTDDTCSDAFDNDGDKHTDCEDADCRSAGVASCTEIEAAQLCSDGIDNDGDTFVDCLDSGCSDAPVCQGVVRENTSDTCTNRLDDDNDKRTDCADSDCQIPSVPACGEESDKAGNCADDFDNDGDGQLDCDDSGCASASNCASTPKEDSLDACRDLEDNDNDLSIDCDDVDCAGFDFCGEFEAGEAFCRDNFDNDGDGFIDCFDDDCATTNACTTPPESDCTNGLDDDQDGAIDCRDNDCSVSSDCGPENTDVFCADARDNDNNGLIDCTDPGCDGTGPCQGTVERCDVVGDEDGDGAADCDDFDCLNDFSVTACNISHGFSAQQLQNSSDPTFPVEKRGDAANDPLRLNNVIVYFIDPNEPGDFYVIDSGAQFACLPNNLAGCYNGMRVHMVAGDTRFLNVGDTVNVAGVLFEFTGETAVAGFALERTASGAALPSSDLVSVDLFYDDLPAAERRNDRYVVNPLTDAIEDPYDDLFTAERWEGALISFIDLEVQETSVDERGATLYTLWDPRLSLAVLVGSEYYEPSTPPILGQKIEIVTGVGRYRHVPVANGFVTHYRLEPRSAGDWTFNLLSDRDGDGLTDSEEVALGTDPDHKDTDRDSFEDLFEVVDPANPSDIDNDGLHDAIESFLLDRDGDDTPDEFDAVQLDGPNDDRDADGIPNHLDRDDDNDGICDPGERAVAGECYLVAGAADNCPYAPEPQAGRRPVQDNTDANLVDEMIAFGRRLGDVYDEQTSGNACDWDIDGDFIANPIDNCPYHFNPGQEDGDTNSGGTVVGDGFGDVCDQEPLDPNVQTRKTPRPCGIELSQAEIDALPWSPVALGGFSHCDLIIDEVLYNISTAGGATPLDANLDGVGSTSQDEFIELRNVSGFALDVSGIEIHDAVSLTNDSIDNRHAVPAGTILRRDQRLVIFGGGSPSGFGRSLVQTASSGSLGFTNDEDLVVVSIPTSPTVSHDLAILGYGLDLPCPTAADDEASCRAAYCTWLASPPTCRNIEPATDNNVSLSRYPQGTRVYSPHPTRTYQVGATTVTMPASPGLAPDNAR